MPLALILALVCVSGAHAIDDTNMTKTPKDVGNLFLNDKNSKINSVLDGASKAYDFINEKNSVPDCLETSDGETVKKPQFIHLMAKTILYLDDPTQNEIVENDFNNNIKPASTPYYGTSYCELKKTEYLDIAKRLVNFVEKNKRLPNYVSTKSGKIGCDLLFAVFSNVLTTYKNTGELPENVKICLADKYQVIGQIMMKAAKYRYISGISTLEEFLRAGGGDCWAMSEYLFNELTKAGIKARIIQYATAYAPNHRTVQYFKDGRWIDLPYRSYPINMLFWNTYSKPCMCVIKVNNC